MNIAALLACLSFYSALYLFYFFFMQDQQPIFLILAIVLILLSIWLTPYPYERRRQGFDSTLRIGEYFYYPLITWWRLFIFLCVGCFPYFILIKKAPEGASLHSIQFRFLIKVLQGLPDNGSGYLPAKFCRYYQIAPLASLLSRMGKYYVSHE
jgi:hypothetical protein